MGSVNIKKAPVKTHEGAKAQSISPSLELRRSVLTCMLWENIFYEKGHSVAERIASLVKEVSPIEVANLAREARDKMYLRHVPLFLVRELARQKGHRHLVSETLAHVIQRPDELTEFMAMYWKDGGGDKRKSTEKMSHGALEGLARACGKFDEYQFSKYRGDTKNVKLKDVLRICHPKPKDKEQSELFKKVSEGTLSPPDTWETALMSGKDKKETFERLLKESRLGGMALLRNLRNMKTAGVDHELIVSRLRQGVRRALPFRFIAAAKHAPDFEPALEAGMLESVKTFPKLPGSTLLVVDISGSMSGKLSGRSEMLRMDAAFGISILARELCDDIVIYATAGDDWKREHATGKVPPRRGFALSDAIRSQNDTLGGGGIFMVQCMDHIDSREHREFNRVILFTDEQDCDTKLSPMSAKKLGRFNYVVNVAPERYGVSYGNGWIHIDGFSERVLEYIAVSEQLGQ